MNLYRVCFSGLSLLLAACSPPDSARLGVQPPVDVGKLTPECFGAHPANPIIPWFSHFDGATWNDPSVLYVDGQFVMYLSSDVSLDHDIKIHRLVSNDGINWTHSPTTAVFSRSATGWDSASVETPSIVHFNGQYHMFYTGYATSYDDPYDFKIGHAVSGDGINWMRRDSYIAAPTDPRNTTYNFDFNQWVVAEPGAVVFNDQIYLYFTALGANVSTGTDLQVIGLMRSADGVSWSAPEEALLPDQDLYPRASGYIGYSTPSAIILNDAVHLFFDVAHQTPELGWRQVKLHHAVSPNGRNEWVHDGTAVHSHDDFQWTLTEIRSPSPLLVGSTLYLWYAGHNDGSAAGIGLSTCNLGNGTD